MNYLPQRRVALSLLAHPDDAAMQCAGTLIRLANAGWEIHIATVANGDCGSATLPKAEIAAIRFREGTAAANVIGARYHCLDEPDVNLAFDKPTIRKVTHLFRRVAPTLLFTHPRHDYMLDHETVHTLARAAAFSYSIPNASELPLVDGSAIPWLYYCDPIESRDPYTGALVVPTTYVDVTAELNRKIEMLVCHASQREWLQAHHGMDEYVEAMKRFGAERGEQYGVRYAEAFTMHRGHPFPQTDLLSRLFARE